MGLSKASCPSISKPGNFYISLANKSGGKAFNICDQDWSPYYNELTNTIKNEVAGSKVETGLSPNIKIISVYLNGQKLNSSEYSFSANATITIFKQGVKAGDTIKVNYNDY